MKDNYSLLFGTSTYHKLRAKYDAVQKKSTRFQPKFLALPFAVKREHDEIANDPEEGDNEEEKEMEVEEQPAVETVPPEDEESSYPIYSGLTEDGLSMIIIVSGSVDGTLGVYNRQNEQENRYYKYTDFPNFYNPIVSTDNHYCLIQVSKVFIY